MKKILKIFGLIHTSDRAKEIEGLRKDIELLQSDVKNRNEEILQLKATNISLIEKKVVRPEIPIDLGDPSPSDGEKRQLYVASAAGFHKDILAPKILQVIGGLRESFEKIDSNTFGMKRFDYDLYLKATINSLWLLYDWGESMINEQIANQQGITEEETDELKTKLD